MDKQYHIGFDNSHGCEYAILPGDPGRVEKIAMYLENPKFYNQNREYTTWIGELQEKKVLVMSTGMGGPSTAIAVEELFVTGVKSFIRVGTSGGMAEKVVGGDIIIATGAIRLDGTSKEYVPIEFPAIADINVTNALIKAAQKYEFSYHAGIVHCKDSFYGQHDPTRMPIGYELINKWDAWIKAGCLASEMESATLFIVSQILGAKAGCVLSAIWNQERRKKGLEDSHCYDMDKAIQVSIEAIRTMINEE